MASLELVRRQSYDIVLLACAGLSWSDVSALVVYIVLILQAGRAAQNPAYWDETGLLMLDRAVKH